MYMTDQYPRLDGRSLEDSHTNIFALTDLSGIHYRVYRPKDDKNYSVYDDPLLSAYNNCLRENLMCAWVRRKRASTEPHKPDIFSNFSKELWVFWYGSDDPCTRSRDRLISSDLEECSSGNWGNGLTYETRCVLFKALHNVIERYLLKKGYVRLGKWFLQPCNSQSIRDKAQYSINFSFFLHGESTVCASLDIRRFPKFKSLTSRILSFCEKSGGRFNVVLAPYGITAHLVVPSRAYTNDGFVDKELESWKRFFPMRSPGESYSHPNSSAHRNSFYLDFLTPNKSSPAQQQPQGSRSDVFSKRSSAGSTEQLPEFVNVLIGGFRVRYPTCFVLIAEDKLTSLTEHLQDGSDRRLTLPLKSRQFTSESYGFSHPRLPLRQLPNTKRRLYLATRALQRALRFERPLLPELDCLHIRSRLLTQATVDDTVFKTNPEAKSPQIVLPLHRRSGSVSRMLCSFISEIDTSLGNGGGSSSDAPPSGPRRQPSSTDPLMPKLSPQPYNAVTFGVGGVSTAVSDSHSASVGAAVAVSSLQAAHHVGAVKLTYLFNSQLMNPKESGSTHSKPKPMDWDETHVSPITSKLPRCVVRIPQAPTQQAKPLPPLTVKSEARGSETSWLARQVVYQCRRPPIIHLSYLDQVNFLEHSSTSFGEEFIRRPRHHCHSQMPSGHQYGGTIGVIMDAYGLNNDSQVSQQQRHHFYRASHPCYKQDQPYSTKDLDIYTHDSHVPESFHHTLEEELYGPNFKPEGPLKGSCPMRNQMRHTSGRNLLNSSGLGNLGSAELAVMYPTPSSLETTLSVGIGGPCQPSPAEVKPLLLHPGETHLSYLEEAHLCQNQSLTNAIVQSILHNARPLFDQEIVCFHREWQFMCPPSVQIPFSAKFKLTPDELHQYKEVDMTLRPTLGFEPASGPMNGQYDGIFQHLPCRLLHPLSSSHPPQRPNSHSSRGHSQADYVALATEPDSNNFDLDELRGSDALKVNIILSDSLLNLFKDHNFDSCNICECATSILGMEIDVYVSTPSPAPTRSCNCGFSALVNRKFALAGNLFWEDEVEVASLSIASVDVAKLRPRKPPPSRATATTYIPVLIQWMRGSFEEFGVRFLVEWLQNVDNATTSTEVRQGTVEKGALYDYNDLCALTASALEQSACDLSSLTEMMVGDYSPRGNVAARYLRLDEATRKEGVGFHPAVFRQLPSDLPSNKNDQIRLLGSVRLWLQEAIDQLESTYKVEGPLTWKAFHQLAGRGHSESSKAQPIPQFRVGGGLKNGNTNVLISPFSVRDWDHLSLAPLSRSKRVAFAVVLPSWQSHGVSSVGLEGQRRLVETLSTFFYELSSAFENCLFGQHYPYYQPKAGNPESAFIHVQCSFPYKDENDLSTGFSPINARQSRRRQQSGGGGAHPTDALLFSLQRYKSAALHAVRKALSERGVALPDGSCSSLLAPFAGIQDMPPSTPPVILSKISPLNGQGPLTTAFDPNADSQYDVTLVIYLVDPFTQLFDMGDESRNVTTRCLAETAGRMTAQLPMSWRQRVSVQLLPMSHVVSPRCGAIGHEDAGDAGLLSHIKSMAFAIYTSIDRVVSPSLINANRTLTGMGPAAEKEVISANFQKDHIHRVYAPAYTLAQAHDLWGQWDVHPAEPLQPSSVLFVSYCLSEDLQWLLATCTDQYGTLAQQTFINIGAPESMFAPSGQSAAGVGADGSHISTRRLALARLWDFIISVITTTSNPWRLVVGRLGRLGHGELKGWCGLLSRKNLQNVNRSLRANCALCNVVTLTPATLSNTGPIYRGKSTATTSLTADSRVPNTCAHETPSLISACLVSTEPQSTFRLFPGSDLNAGDLGGFSSHGIGGHGGGGVGGGGGGGGGGSTSVSGGGAGVAGGPAGQAFVGPFANGVISAAGYAPSTTHILVFPTSTSAQAQSEQDDINFTEIFSEFYEDLDDHTAVGMPSLDTLTTPTSAGPGCNLANVAAGVVGGGGPCTGVSQDPNGVGTSQLMPMARSGIPAEPNTHGMTYEVACRERAKYFLLDALLPFGVPDPQSEKPSLMQQPLALGYYVSTAPVGPLPAWFWAACQQTRRNNPVCLKSSLHLHCTLVGVDDDAAANGGQQCPSSNSATAGGHLLDSGVTCDVLRFVLECYNALSWLSYDPCINDRRSCLPVHILSLAQLYQAAKAFV